MNESNKNKKPSRWAELAEDLGLMEGSTESAKPAAPEPAKLATPEPAAPPPPRRDPAPVHRPQPERQQPAPPVVVTQIVEEVELTYESSDEGMDEGESIETPPMLSESSPDTVLDEEGAAPGGEGAGSSRSSSRRRRRRRSSKKKKDAPGTETGEVSEAEAGEASPPVEEREAELEPAAASGETPEKPHEEKTGERERGRGRSRGGRRRREPEPEPVTAAHHHHHEEDEVHESGGNVGLDEEEDDDEPVNYSNWTVPAWKDLIASLYRPER